MYEIIWANFHASLTRTMQPEYKMRNKMRNKLAYAHYIYLQSHAGNIV